MSIKEYIEKLRKEDPEFDKEWSKRDLRLELERLIYRIKLFLRIK